jgi:hypothetical protein
LLRVEGISIYFNKIKTVNNHFIFLGLLYLQVHRKKKGSRVSRPQPDVTTKLSLGGNNDVITELFLPTGSLVSETGDGKLVNLFLGCG